MNKRLEIKKTAATVLSLNIIQIISIVAIIIYICYVNGEFILSTKFLSLVVLFFIILLAVSMNSYIAIRNKYEMTYADSQYTLLKDTLQQVENLNKTLRAQRHDFMNHLQVVYSLMEMEEYSDAKEYIDRVYNDIQKISKVLKTSNSAVNALLQAKALSCEKREIQTEFTVTSNLESIRVPSWELCKILGNLIDNSISALEEVSGTGILRIEIYENLNAHCFRIINNGPQIPEGLTDIIFQAGFTTKGEKGEGMGLAIVKETLQEYSGSISVNSSKYETVFEVSIPK